MASPAHESCAKCEINWSQHLSPESPHCHEQENKECITQKANQNLHSRITEPHNFFRTPPELIIARTTMLQLLSLEDFLERQRTTKKREPSNILPEQEENSTNLSQKTTYIFNNLLLQNFDVTIYLYAFVLFNKARFRINERSMKLRKGDLVKIYSVCFFIAFKMVEESHKMFIEDLSILTGYSEEEMSQLEEFILIDVLDFKVFIRQEEIDINARWLANVYRNSQRSTAMGY